MTALGTVDLMPETGDLRSADAPGAVDQPAAPTGADPGRRAATEPFPLTDLQAGYLVGSSSLIELGGFHPTMYLEFDLVGFDPDRARRAIDTLIRRHEHLRTLMLAEGAQRALAAEEVAPFELPVVDLAGLDPRTQERSILETRHTFCERGIEPTGWPLFKIVAHRVRPHRYRVSFAMSLLLLDSRSTRLLQDEWRRLYLDPAAPLPPVERTFRECVLDRAAHERTEQFGKHWAYWEQRLDSLPEAPVLPLSGGLADLDPGRLVRRTHHLEPERWRRLTAAFRAHRILPNAALIHVYAETLGAWATDPHFCLNVLHQNWTTTHPETEGVVGQFSSTLPLEVDLSGEGGFWSRAERLQRRLWQDMAHSEVTAVRVTRELAARRGWSARAALPYVFNSMLGPAASGVQAVPRPACRSVYSNLRTPQVLIDNQVVDAADGGVDCVWDVVDDAFPPGLADTMFEGYCRMLDALAAPEGAQAEPTALSPQYRALIDRDNAADRAVVRGRLEEGFLRQAAIRPDDPAVLTSARTLTYRQLDAASCAVAGWLRGHGIRPGEVVPVVMAKGWEQVVAVLGVLRAGAAYCPVDADLPTERISSLLDDCSARVVLGQSHRDPLRGIDTGRPILHVDRQDSDDPAGAGAAGSVTDGAASAFGPDDLAYIIYTSGSTGKPKGVMTEHTAALNTITDVNDRIGLGPRDRVFGISSLSFDLSVWDVFGTLAAGAALVLPDPTPSNRPDPVGWARAAAKHGASVWNSVPALAELLAEVAELEESGRRAPVRCFLLSGDWVPPTLPDRLRRVFPEPRVIALGGATEASIWSNSYEVGRVDPAWRGVPYGRPLRLQTMRVLDQRLELRPPWAVGRIHIGGAGLARGYWRDEERTAQRFITDPRTGQRLYWTGDLGRYWPDGTIEFLGREDRQAKIQGFRVEPGEVEAAIRRCPGVRECMVAVQDGPAGQKRLVALVVAEDGVVLDPAAVTTRLRARLPHYMVPGLIYPVPRLELSANGKVDPARSLAAASRAATSPDGSATAAAARTSTADQDTAQLSGAPACPQEQTEARLAELWRELLEVDAVGPEADFFALGGNSLLALRLVNQVEARLGPRLRFGEIFEARTLRALAERVDGENGNGENGNGENGNGEGGQPAARTGAASGPDRGAGNCVTLATRPGTDLFLFHPVGGSVLCYTELARVWAGTVRAFQAPALSRDAAPGAAADSALELAAMAAEYRGELLAIKPQGPYLLGGWSLGGVLAHEVGRQLAALGHGCRVFMIDSDISTLRKPATEAQSHLEFLADLAGGTLPGGLAPLVLAARPQELDRAARDAAVAHGLLPAELDLSGYRRLMSVHRDNLAALARHRPASSQVPTLLVSAGEVRRADPVPAWRALCPRLDVELWPHDHYSIMAADRQRSLAERVRTWSCLT